MTEDEIVGWHHQLNGHEFEQAPGNGEGQEAWCAAVHGVTKSRIQLSNCTTPTSKDRILISSATTQGPQLSRCLVTKMNVC